MTKQAKKMLMAFFLESQDLDFGFSISLPLTDGCFSGFFSFPGHDADPDGKGLELTGTVFS